MTNPSPHRSSWTHSDQSRHHTAHTTNHRQQPPRETQNSVSSFVFGQFEVRDAEAEIGAYGACLGETVDRQCEGWRVAADASGVEGLALHAFQSGVCDGKSFTGVPFPM
jgi:hypothetical protein